MIVPLVGLPLRSRPPDGDPGVATPPLPLDEDDEPLRELADDPVSDDDEEDDREVAVPLDPDEPELEPELELVLGFEREPDD